VVKVFQENKVDLAIVIAFGVIFPEDILNLPRLGTVNVHFSLLPEYRGASPVQSAILNGDKTSGITIQKMVKALDAGDNLWQKDYSIENKKTSELWDFFAHETAKEMPLFLEEYFRNNITPKPQNESEATFCHKFEKHDGIVNPKIERAEIIYQKYLAFDVWPHIAMETDKGMMKLTDVSLAEKEGTYPLLCADNTKLYIAKAQLAGKKEMSIGDILRGNVGVL
jgi:methionyl-tRNA formyltransferase